MNGTDIAGERELRAIRVLLALFMAGLVLSGLTAFPLLTEARLLVRLLPDAAQPAPSAFTAWMLQVRDALEHTARTYPFLPYGTDWLAFAHVVIAVAFIGPWRDPVRNAWVVDFGLIACAAVIPLALIAGSVRGIPLWWRLIDCSFGILGAVPLLWVRRLSGRLSPPDRPPPARAAASPAACADCSRRSSPPTTPR